MSANGSKSAVDEVWDSVVGGFDWLKSVLLGEFADNRPLSAVVADMLVSFIPGVVIVTSARDAVAVTLRLAERPERRQELMEWVLLCACLITLALPLVMAAGGAAAAGVGAIVGGVAGSELGAALRAVMLLLIKQASKLVDVVKFLQKFIKGDILKFLRAVKFSQYEKALLQTLDSIISKLMSIVRSVRAKLMQLPSFSYTQELIRKLSEWERRFYSLQQDALEYVPKALAELQLRLDKVLAQTLPPEAHIATSGTKAPKPEAVVPARQEVNDVAGQVVKSESTKPSSTGNPAPASPGKSAPTSSSTGGGGAPPPRKDKPEPPKKADEGNNTKKQETLDPEALAAREKAATIKDKIGSDIKSHPLRQAYESEVGGLKQKADDMLTNGTPKSEVAHEMWQARRDIGVKYKDLTPDPLRDYIYEVNQGRYGDPLGPKFDDLVSKQLEQGKSLDEAYEKIISSSSTPNSDVNALLSKFETWLQGKDPAYLDQALKTLGGP